MGLVIHFDPPNNDGFDDHRCKITVEGPGFSGETRYRNIDVRAFALLARDTAEFPIVNRLAYEWFDGLLTFHLESLGSLGDLRLMLRMAEEIDRNEVTVDTRSTYAALQRFSSELSILIERGEGEASLVG